MSIETLKEQARRHEQKEEWQKALDEYKVAIKKLAEDDQPDIGLYNRVGDLYVRVGDLEAAVEHYEQSVELYMETFLPNNAIAVCKKIIRNMPDRHDAYLRMGQIRAEQGFLPDARANFLTYAERMQQAGDLDESFRALVEFCDLAPDELDIRMMVADQMASHDRIDDAIEQLRHAHRHLMAKGAVDEASAVEAKIRELDPSADVDVDDLMGHFSDIATGGSEDQETDDTVVDVDLGGFDIDTDGDAEQQGGDEVSDVDSAAEASGDLPTFDTGGAADDEAGGDLPTFDMGGAADDEASGDLPTFDMGGAAADDAGADLPTLDTGRAADDEAGGDLPMLDTGDHATADADEREVIAPEVEESVQEAMEEVAADDGAGDEARTLEDGPSVQPVREVVPSEGYVDLGALLLGDDEGEKSTRFTVAYEEPTGDEEADFAKMLSQFKEKVSENLDADDVMAHHDLGTAYREMGLLDEAVTEYQAALRAAPNHLATYELMGLTFMDMGQPEATVNSLERALGVEYEIEDELLGIYYYLARANEDLGKTERAVELYEKVFSLDINFEDVTDRLRALR